MEFEIASVTGRIHYGFGSDYLPQWGIKEALREIYQNFIDYGEYDEEVTEFGDTVNVKLVNGWKPDNLNYLRIGNSRKDNPQAIGHHGEGLKMAFLILLREQYESMIFTPRYAVYPEWYNDKEIGTCFCFNYEVHDFSEAPYTLEFSCPTKAFREFHNNLVRPEDVIYSHPEYGDMINKEAGNIYSGGLFVIKADGLSRSYNIKPRHLPLDRDRAAPRSFDVNWATSKILEASEKMTARDFSYSDTAYASSVPKHILPEIKPRRVGNAIEFTIKDDEGNDQVIRNTSIKDALQRDGYFHKAIAGIKRFLAKQLGLYDLLLEFKQKHVHSAEALQDFEVILEKVNK